MLSELFVFIFDNLNLTCKVPCAVAPRLPFNCLALQKEMHAIWKQYPCEPLVFRRETPILTFPEAIALLRTQTPDFRDLEEIRFRSEQQNRMRVCFDFIF